MKYKNTNWKYVLTDRFTHEFTTPLKDKFSEAFLTCGENCGERSESEVCFSHSSETFLFCINKNCMVVEKYYAWDGPSGPTIDTSNSMRASLVHDVLYQAIREEGFARKFRGRADLEFLRILKSDGMSFPRRWIWWSAVRLFGGGHARQNR